MNTKTFNGIQKHKFMDDLERRIQDFRREIYENMVRTHVENKTNITWFVLALKSFKYFPGNEIRGEFLDSYYALMRYIDDVVDGDAQLPEGYQSREEFVQRRVSFSHYPQNPVESVDHLMAYCFGLAKRMGHDFSQETQDMASSMLFDARRMGKGTIFSERELFHHFYLLDIRGCIVASLKVFGEYPLKYKALEDLGIAVRIYYNLRDFDSDLKAGLVNIPAEDFKRLSMTVDSLDDRFSVSVQQWFKEQAAKGMASLAKHRLRMMTVDFRLLTRTTLYTVYERPARRYFQSVLGNLRE